MLVIENYCDEVLKSNNYAALGSFDGLHKGHISLIEKTVELAKKRNGKSMVFTFKNHPRSVFDKNYVPCLIMSNEKKEELLKNKNIDILCFKKFDSDFMKYSPEEFIKMLIEQFNVKGIVVGFNYRFGFKNLGDVALLKKMQKIYNYELYVMDPYLYEGNPISSTRIRNAILEGEIFKATNMLGFQYIVDGKVVHGREIGRTIGFTTANLQIDKKFVIPKIGVYCTNVFVNNNVYRGITNIGNNPTVCGKKITIETFILDFNDDIYDKKMELSFISKIRNQRKFNSLEDLKHQLEKDKDYARNLSLNH